MCRTFNCGIGAVLVVDNSNVDYILGNLKDSAMVIGNVNARGRYILHFEKENCYKVKDILIVTVNNHQ